MKLNYVKIERILEGLKELIELELPVKTSFKIRKIIKTLSSDYNVFVEERNNIIKKFELDEKGSIKSDEDKNKAIELIHEIAIEEIEYNLEKITFDELGDCKIKTSTILNIDNILEE